MPYRIHGSYSALDGGGMFDVERWEDLPFVVNDGTFSCVRKTRPTRPTPIGGADDWLVGYDLDHVPMAWMHGEPPEPAEEGRDYGGWYVDRFGFDLFWRDPDGNPHRL